jgi:hypothetical protein
MPGPLQPECPIALSSGGQNHDFFHACGGARGPETIVVKPVPVPELKPGMVRLRVRRAGICGSDLHYFEHGCCGAFVPTRPFILGHEFSAEVAAVGEGVNSVPVGVRVTANPARACGVCDYCKNGRGNLCRQTIMLGSASTTPPTRRGLRRICHGSRGPVSRAAGEHGRCDCRHAGAVGRGAPRGEAGWGGLG